MPFKWVRLDALLCWFCSRRHFPANSRAKPMSHVIIIRGLHVCQWCLSDLSLCGARTKSRLPTGRSGRSGRSGRRYVPRKFAPSQLGKEASPQDSSRRLLVHSCLPNLFLFLLPSLHLIHLSSCNNPLETRTPISTRFIGLNEVARPPPHHLPPPLSIPGSALFPAIQRHFVILVSGGLTLRPCTYPPTR